MKSRFATFAMITLLSTASAVAYAQDNLSVRAGAHNGYERLVFDWQEPVSYKVSDGKDSVTINFGASTSFNGAAVDLDGFHLIRGLSGGRDQNGHLYVKINLNSHSGLRDFKIGDRVVLDVLGSAAKKQNNAQAPQKKTVSSTKQQKPALAVPANPAKPVEAEKLAADHKGQVHVDTLGAQNAAKKKNLILSAAPSIEPHAISVSLTEATGMAAFVRGNDLWVVLDRPNINVPPQIEGPQKDKFAPFERIDEKDGTAYRTVLPRFKDLNLYGEGGNLVWRVILSPNARDESKPTPLDREFTEGDLVRGGTALWPLKNITRIIDVKDPDIGDVMKVVTVKKSGQFTGAAQDFPEFTALRAPIGAAIVPKTDDIKLEADKDGLKVEKEQGGLALSRQKDISQKEMRENVTNNSPDQLGDAGNIKRIFDFDRWMMGGLHALDENQRIVLTNAAHKDADGKAQDLLSLAKVNLANDRGQEAIGFLDLAAQILPGIRDSLEFKALRGASYAVAGKYELALRDLNDPALKEYNELDYWRAYTLAWLEDWQQAAQVLPHDFSVLKAYPKELLEKLSVKLAEVALRAGNVDEADEILSVLNGERERLDLPILAGLDYLQGEADRQEGDIEGARKLWSKLTHSPDDFYRVRAGFALTLLDVGDGKITKDKAIDQLEGLRYAWRGDGLEAQINAKLGELYLNTGQYLKGFTILRDAAAMSPGTDTGRAITTMMATRFQDLLMNDKDLSPVDAVTVYEEFKELTPPGDEGNKLVQRLAGRLEEAEFYDRAAKILKHQVQYRLSGKEKADVALHLATVDIQADKAGDALDALTITESYYANNKAADAKEKLREVKLLRAKALAKTGQTEKAIALLNEFPPDPNVNRLRADIAWQAQMWPDAAEALQDLILDESLDPARPLTEKQAELILNRAVALNLAADRVQLANMRTKYESAMAKTSKGKLFDVVTLPRKNMVYIDRKTIDDLVSDANIFRDFLDHFPKN